MSKQDGLILVRSVLTPGLGREDQAGRYSDPLLLRAASSRTALARLGLGLLPRDGSRGELFSLGGSLPPAAVAATTLGPFRRPG